MSDYEPDIVYFHPPQSVPSRGAEIGWMQFRSAKTKECAHVFRPNPRDPRMMYSLCGRWLTPEHHSTNKAAMLVPAEDDRPHCKHCEKKWAELNDSAIQT